MEKSKTVTRHRSPSPAPRRTASSSSPATTAVLHHTGGRSASPSQSQTGRGRLMEGSVTAAAADNYSTVDGSPGNANANDADPWQAPQFATTENNNSNNNNKNNVWSSWNVAAGGSSAATATATADPCFAPTALGARGNDWGSTVQPSSSGGGGDSSQGWNDEAAWFRSRSGDSVNDYNSNDNDDDDEIDYDDDDEQQQQPVRPKLGSVDRPIVLEERAGARHDGDDDDDDDSRMDDDHNDDNGGVVIDDAALQARENDVLRQAARKSNRDLAEVDSRDQDILLTAQRKFGRSGSASGSANSSFQQLDDGIGSTSKRTAPGSAEKKERKGLLRFFGGVRERNTVLVCVCVCAVSRLSMDWHLTVLFPFSFLLYRRAVAKRARPKNMQSCRWKKKPLPRLR